jgi:hypothetical protein
MGLKILALPDCTCPRGPSSRPGLRDLQPGLARVTPQLSSRVPVLDATAPASMLIKQSNVDVVGIAWHGCVCYCNGCVQLSHIPHSMHIHPISLRHRASALVVQKHVRLLLLLLLLLRQTTPLPLPVQCYAISVHINQRSTQNQKSLSHPPLGV